MPLPEPRDDATVLVTGASSGIGEAIATALASRGYGVTLTARREERLLELASRLNSTHGVRAGVVACDLGQPGERDRLAAELEKLELEVDVLVNNAGFGFTGEFAGADRARQVEMVRLNCEAVVDLSARYLQPMVGRGMGAVINIASTAAFQPLPLSATYGATKSFVLSHSEALHHELGGTGVTVTAVCPGPVRTEFTEAAGIGGAEDSTPGFIWMTPEQIAAEALSAAESGKRAVVAGWMNYATSILGRHTPRALSLPVAARLWQRVD